jgi:hypothetical protein
MRGFLCDVTTSGLKYAPTQEGGYFDTLPFVTVTYGLSNIGLSIPEALTPDEVPPMPDRIERRNRLDHEDTYAK